MGAMAVRQDPPGGKPGVMIAIGVPKNGADKGGRMAPPGGQGGAAGKTKASPVEATVIRNNEHCIDCQNYNPQDGTCEQVDGQFDPQDACVKYFSPIQQDNEPDADDRASGDSGQDYDADDSQ